MSSLGNRIISKHDKRISLRCPCSISQSSLEQDKADGKYSIKLSIENEGDGSIDNDTVKNISLVVRCTDSNGNNILFDDNDYLVKTVNFGEAGLERSQEITMAVMLGDFANTALTDFEVYVSRIRFADGTVLDYLRADFFPLPAKPVPLLKKLGENGEADAKAVFGESVEYLPEKLSEVVWRCTCGEICESASCPLCGCDRDELCSHFGVTEITPPKNDVVSSARAKGTKINTRALTVSILSGVAVILFVILLILLLSKCNAETGNDDPDDGNSTTTTTENNGADDPDTKAGEALADAYADENLYDMALSVCASNKLSPEFTNSIRARAAEYYAQQGDNIKAYTYASQIADYEGLAAIAEGAYNECMSAEDYAEAIKYAQALSDASKKAAAVSAMTDGLIAKGDYLEAYRTAVLHGEDALASQIASDGIDTLKSAREYDLAIALAKETGNSDSVGAINSEAASYYISIRDYNSAAKYAAASGDREVLSELCSKLDDETLRMNLPAYSEYLSAQRRREILAQRIGGGRLASVIMSDGSVVYGMAQTFTPPTGVKAVSVSSGTSHTVVLLSNGQVRAFGDNSYGQCSLSSVTGAVAISAAGNHTVVLLEDGTLRAFGDNSYGQCSVSSFADVVSVSAGETATLALTKEGKVLSTSASIDTSALENVVGISAGRVHALALTADGTVISVGSPLLGMGAVEEWTDVVRISACSTFSVGLTKDGKVLFTGAVIGSEFTKAELASLSGAVEIFAADGYLLALFENGNVKAVGPLAPKLEGIS